MHRNKTFNIILKGKTLLDINALKKLVSGMQKLASDRLIRKYSVNYSIKYDDLKLDDKKLYLDYYRVLLTEIMVDYELLGLSNFNVDFDGSSYIINLSDENKVNDKVIAKALNIFSKLEIFSLFKLFPT